VEYFSILAASAAESCLNVGRATSREATGQLAPV